MRLRCLFCGNSVSTEVPDDTIVRALIMCPDCMEKQCGECKEVGGHDETCSKFNAN